MTRAQIAIAVDAGDPVQTRLETCREMAIASRAAVIGVAAANCPRPRSVPSQAAGLQRICRNYL
jgi:hypothetical protein